MPEPRTAPPPAAPPTVLVVEDEVLVRLAVADYLRECGWHVIEASSGVEARQILQSVDVTIDVVFSGIQMPGDLDGFGLAKWVHANCPGIRVLLTSGRPSAVAIKAGDLCEDAPAQQPFILRKPYHHHEVVRRIESMIRRSAKL